jgi:tetratricopeptide (TPR) repeat protein/tRNA A-37 threonylcarbamoyl transferase component Bud32
MATQEQLCENCGAVNTSSSRFCQRCSATLLFDHTTETLPEQTLISGRYQLEARVGQGGMGAVYKAFDTRFNNRPIAIKEMSRNGLSALQIQEAEDAFERESRILADLLHPNLPRIYDHFTENERSYLVMDFIEGQTLEDYLEKANGSPLPLDQVIEWGEQVCDVLSYLHNHPPPIIFRDLKPANVMISESGHVFLIDFGIARFFKPGQSHDTVALGSPGFAAPEQYGKAQSSPRSDIYSLGALLHCLLTGVDPSEQPFFFKPVTQLNPAIPPILEELLQQMLEMDAQKRPASAQDVLKVLRQALQDRFSSTVSQPLTAIRSTQKKVITPDNALLQDAYQLYTQQRLPDALAIYDRILQTDSRNTLAWQGRGLTLAMQGKHQEALDAFERALRINPNLVTSLTGKGAALNMLRRNKEALDVFDRAVLLEKNNVIAWNGKGAAQKALGQSELALTSFDVALHYNPTMAQAWANKGLVLRHLRRYPEALRAFEEALQLDVHSVAYWNGKGLVLSEMGRLSEARRAYQQALRIDPNYAPAYCGLGDILYGQGELNDALNHYERALTCDSRFGRAWEKRAIVLADLGRFHKALESYNEALRLDSRNIVAWNGKASALCHLERYPEALDAYNRALLINSNAAQAWNGKGNAFYHLGDYERALDAYERALRLNPRMASAQHNKSLVLKHLERYDEALNAAENAIRLAPKDPDNWQRKAEALKKLRRKREARAAETEAARLRKDL